MKLNIRELAVFEISLNEHVDRLEQEKKDRSTTMLNQEIFDTRLLIQKVRDEKEALLQQGGRL